MDMREKMARAMFPDKNCFGVTWDNAPIWLCKRYLGMADVALSAMEEPTEAMVGAGTRAYDEGDGEYGIYRAMIRKAKEG